MPPLNLILTWLGILAGAAVVLFVIAVLWARRTPNDIDDVIVGVLQWPVIIVLLLFALQENARASALTEQTQFVVGRVINVALIFVVSLGLWQLVRNVVLYYGHQLAQRTNSNFDDVLIPVLDVLAPAVIIVTAALLMLRLLGADLSTVITTAGFAAFVVGLVMKDTVTNIVGGLLLLIDTPFRFGDLILWDNIVCQIKRIGLRVTTLYNTEDHADIFVPNTSLGTGKLTNLTRPSPDLRIPVDITITDTGLLKPAVAMLYEIANANPYVLGNLPMKVSAMRRALKSAAPDSPLARELRWGIAALSREHSVDLNIARIVRLLGELLTDIRRVEKGGLSNEENAHLLQQVAILDERDEKLKAAVRRWAQTRTRDPQLRHHPEDRARLLSDIEGRLRAYQTRLDTLRKHLHTPSLYEAQRLDDLVVEFRDWLPRMFKTVTPAWKYPFVSIAQVAAGSVLLRLWVYVDDIHLEGFVRRQRVITALREAGVIGLQKLGKG